ncbi:MAG: 23S rRNA (adenine(2503)-C(2))-methyltransferase RlmN [Bdellovibrionales bacterium]|nr:23S rRNA (adenine(2503)-C(2))-methyltransferase RlmN [Bdellovibrionales bacterium]
MDKVNFYDFTMPKLEAYLMEKGYERFRAKQLFRWVYGQKTIDFALMTNMSKALRQELSEILDFNLPKMVSHLVSTDGTQKFLFDVGGETVESVLIPSEDRMTLCVSSEVGCNIACKFCFTGKQKLKMRLSVSQIMGQYLGAVKVLNDTVRISNIVFMGMGEPLDNPVSVFDAIENLHSPSGCNVSRKKITVSTSGIVPLMPLITKSRTRMAVSLNGANDAVRSFIMPINKKWPLAELLKACREYCDETGDKVTFEYVLLKGITDSIEDARELYRLTKNIPNKINIIPFNEHPGSGFERPAESQIVAFQQELIKLGAHVLRRKTMGRDIFAACGQLRSAYDGHPGRLELAQQGV